MALTVIVQARRSWHQVECPWCAAMSWTKCRTPSGRLLTEPHKARRAVAEANPHVDVWNTP